MTANIKLMAEAREALEGRWGLAVATFFIYFLIVGGVESVPVLGGIGALIIGGPMALGISIFSLKLARGEEARVEQIFEGFQMFEKALGAYLLMVINVFLRLLLLIIPGIIKGIAYSQVFFILAEDDTIDSRGALKRSEEMMDGYKWKYFFLSLNFVGWGILCLLTFGIGFLWLIPYVQVSYANFYDDLKGNDIVSSGMIDDDILDRDLV